jgi:hypothetical protein
MRLKIERIDTETYLFSQSNFGRAFHHDEKLACSFELKGPPV